jgi:hypothetical protein
VVQFLSDAQRWGRFDPAEEPTPFGPVDVEDPIDAVLDLTAEGEPQPARLPTVQPQQIARDLHAELQSAKGRPHLRVSMPPAADETGADSIGLTDRAAMIAEQFVALRSGWAVVNRGVWRRTLKTAVPVICPAQLAVFDRAGAVNRRERLSARDGHVNLVLEPGWGLTVSNLKA